MKYRLFLAVAVLAAAPWFLSAGGTPPTKMAPRPTPPAPPPDGPQDLVFFASDRPVLLRVHVQIEGRPYQAAWNDYLKSLFRFLDVDGDGVLSKQEAERAPKPQTVLQQRQSGFINNQGGLTATLAELDTDKDGCVTFDELAAYYRRNNIGAFQFIANQGQDNLSQALTDVLWNHLDVNKDGKLSKDELQRAPAALAEFDLDDDEMISLAELLPGVTDPRYFDRARMGMRMPQAPAPGAFYLLGSENPSPGLAAELLNRYDRDRSKKLSRAESGLPKEVFDFLDTNHDGELDAEELARFARRPADLELSVRLGKEVGDAKLDLHSPDGRALPLSPAVRQAEPGVLYLTAGDAQVLWRAVRPAQASFGRLNNLRDFYLQQFDQADGNGDGFLEQKEVEQIRFLQVLFPLADRNNDGKLSRQELIDYLDVVDSVRASFVTVMVTDVGRGLFEFLDADDDGRLGQRELRTAWARLSVWDRDGDGLIARHEVPRQLHVTVSRGQSQFLSRLAQVAGNVRGMDVRPGGKGRGPLWFRKMDRNGDGDVSFREFLGSPEDFGRIDTDGDGLISVEEAERADVWFRERLRGK
jgi:Ca2+-binding EF-hand superfamily protein